MFLRTCQINLWLKYYVQVSTVPAFAIGTQPRWVHTPMITSHLSSCTLSESCSGWRRDDRSTFLSVCISDGVLNNNSELCFSRIVHGISVIVSLTTATIMEQLSYTDTPDLDTKFLVSYLHASLSSNNYFDTLFSYIFTWTVILLVPVLDKAVSMVLLWNRIKHNAIYKNLDVSCWFLQEKLLSYLCG